MIHTIDAPLHCLASPTEDSEEATGSPWCCPHSTPVLKKHLKRTYLYDTSCEHRPSVVICSPSLSDCHPVSTLSDTTLAPFRFLQGLDPLGYHFSSERRLSQSQCAAGSNRGARPGHVYFCIACETECGVLRGHESAQTAPAIHTTCPVGIASITSPAHFVLSFHQEQS
jgi:hypothetical protein